MAKTNKVMTTEELVQKAYKKAGVVPKPAQEQLEDIAKKLK